MAEVLRRAKDGFDTRRGGMGLRGRFRADQLIGAHRKSRKEAKRLGLLNSDEEMSSSGEDNSEDEEG